MALDEVVPRNALENSRVMIYFTNLPEDIHFYICKSQCPRHISRLVLTCIRLHNRLNPELWKGIFASKSAREELFLNSARLGSLSITRRLADRSNFDFSGLAAHEALRIATTNGLSSVVAYMLAEGLDYCREASYRNLQKATFPGLDEPSALQLAADSGYADIVQLLLGHGATIEDKVKALEDAAHNGHEVVVNNLLECGPALPDLLSLASSIPLLQLAISAKAESVLSMLLNQEFNVNMHSSRRYMTPLRQAVEMN
ncbi:hypothetical protein BJX64DRAFT_48852 [Aspergillus heterothallicus]